jgi:hypothetical protein
MYRVLRAFGAGSSRLIAVNPERLAECPLPQEMIRSRTRRLVINSTASPISGRSNEQRAISVGVRRRVPSWVSASGAATHAFGELGAVGSRPRGRVPHCRSRPRAVRVWSHRAVRSRSLFGASSRVSWSAARSRRCWSKNARSWAATRSGWRLLSGAVCPAPRSTARFAPGRALDRPSSEAVRFAALLVPPSSRTSQVSAAKRSSGPVASLTVWAS